VVSEQNADADALAAHLGTIKSEPEVGKYAAQIARLQRRQVVELEQVQRFHEWLEGKRLSRQSCRVVGESRTGKSVACEAYRYRHKPIQKPGEPPIVPVIYLVPPEECGPKDLFSGVLDFLRYQMSRGTVGEMRERAHRLLIACGVEMLIIDEAQRLRPKTFSDVRDLCDRLEIAVVLVGTDRLDAVIRRDEQVIGRFLACHRFQRLTAAQLVTTTVIWETQVLKMPQVSGLAQPTVQRLLGSVSGGYIGRLDQLLRGAAIRALSRGVGRIDLSTLEEIAAELR
jgi:DNA transposition AAA+ family ATPase